MIYQGFFLSGERENYLSFFGKFCSKSPPRVVSRRQICCTISVFCFFVQNSRGCGLRSAQGCDGCVLSVLTNIKVRPVRVDSVLCLFIVVSVSRPAKTRGSNNAAKPCMDGHQESRVASGFVRLVSSRANRPPTGNLRLLMVCICT